MRLIAWDTSSRAGALAALEWDEGSREGWQGVKLVSEWTLNVDLTHSERLLWGIHQLLESARWKIQDVDVFGVGVGPGSFTGVRIGVTTARTLAHTLGKPLVRFSSLAALARPAALWLAEQPIVGKKKVVLVAATDACKGELFALYGNARSIMDCIAWAEGDAGGYWKRGVEERVIAPDDLLKVLKRKLSEGGDSGYWLALGEGRQRYPEFWKKLPQDRELRVPLPFANQVQGRMAGLLAWEAYQAGLASDALRVHPRYLRASDAEIKLKAGLLPPGPTRGN
ncbi:MAG: tRNA (adenosine(37)-N6)-threonylcarbamoyltransferase complex dimerization subunit type 1 TsaB [Bdellovibrionales bacterium GWB1_55_8]|nr:MAG: tRNA (adenosine(37)-N6)-threonylcarbamoyltransferase complex dimerization subunit type 1 TsaB [Bdellovibrionales bacterium GWB1_55_8]